LRQARRAPGAGGADILIRGLRGFIRAGNLFNTELIALI
jgi:hypothetical protein